MGMLEYGFLRVAAAVPRLRIGDCQHNADRVSALLSRAEDEGIDLLVFPELVLTAYTCADLFQQIQLQRGAIDALAHVAREGAKRFSGLAIVGLPVAVDDQLFNCAAVLHAGRILGIITKSFIPNYKEFYEGRWFAAAATARSREIAVDGVAVPFGTDLLFAASDVDGLVVGVEICEDLWVPIPPSSFQALQGASILANLSASNEVIGKSAYRRQLVVNQSARCLAGYVYGGCGLGESSTDVVFGGHCLVAENGVLLAESDRFQREETLLAADVDLDRLRVDRLRTNSFGNAQLYLGVQRAFRRVEFVFRSPWARNKGQELRRPVEAHPFVPAGSEQLRERCEEIFNIQVAGLAQRLGHIGKPPVTIGISGGLDSTLALLVACKAADALSVCRQRIHAFTMPGFGTTARTRANAQALMSHLNVSASEIDIRRLCLEEMRALGHQPFGINLEGLDVDGFSAQLRRLPKGAQDLVFENVQARMRTSLLMNAGFVIGTGDLSELALGWCTYNGDHMSMYNPNAGIPKTLVKFLVRWAAENEFEGETRRTLLDVVATEISPELLPSSADGVSGQSTEGVIGPYELHDFFLFHFLRYGAPPEKILFLAGNARFDRPYRTEEIRRWLRLFIGRFFANQFKRSCLPDGPKVGSVSLSPRGDWRMPSDAEAALWLRWSVAEPVAKAADGQRAGAEPLSTPAGRPT
jgi:NAD+ synthase (glutamine-hydrolysing)